MKPLDASRQLTIEEIAEEAKMVSDRLAGLHADHVPLLDLRVVQWGRQLHQPARHGAPLPGPQRDHLSPAAQHG